MLPWWGDPHYQTDRLQRDLPTFPKPQLIFAVTAALGSIGSLCPSFVGDLEDSYASPPWSFPSKDQSHLPPPIKFQSHIEGLVARDELRERTESWIRKKDLQK